VKKIGFVGLGIMGYPMAVNLIKAKYNLTVYDVFREKADALLKIGASVAASPREVAAQSEIVITMLPSNEVVREVLAGAEGVFNGAKQGTIVIDMSSSSPTLIKELHAKAVEKGLCMLDAPVSGGEPKAIDGSLAIMVGGAREDFERVKEILQAMGSTVTYIGSIGSGNVAKLANQIIVAINIAAISEAISFTSKAGLDPEVVYHAIRGGLAGSTVMDAKLPMMYNRDFKPGARMMVHIKDLRNALEMAHEISAALPLSSQILEYMYSLKAEGKENIDHGGLVQFYEKISHVVVQKKTEGIRSCSGDKND
jgi:2-hydroxy-3-oxopropionate reductase